MYAEDKCQYYGRSLDNGILTLKPSDVMTMTEYCEGKDGGCPLNSRPIDLRDYERPPGAGIYFNFANSPMGRRIILPFECRTTNTICEDLYLPPIIFPASVTQLEREWATCTDGRYSILIWDPPMVMSGTPSVIAASITITSHESIRREEPTALPGQLGASPHAPAATSTPRHGPAPYSYLKDAAPAITFTAGTTTITASPLPDGSGAMVGGHIVEAGGPALTTEGVAITIGPNGEMKVTRQQPMSSASRMQQNLQESIGADRESQTSRLIPPIDRNGRTMVGGKIASIDQAGHTKLIDVSSIIGKITFVDSNGHSVTVDRSQLAGKTISVDGFGQTHMIESSSRPKKTNSVNENADSDLDEPFPTDKGGSIPESGQFHEGPTTETFALGQGQRRKKNGGVAMLDMTCRAHLVWMVVGLVVLL
jgi:hypothetical protein